MGDVSGLALNAQLLAQQGGLNETLGKATPFIWLVAFAFIFYFLLIRPQRQRQKQHDELLKALRPGDKIVSQGGLVGTITKVDEGTTVKVKLAPSIDVTMLKTHVAGKMSGEETP